MRQQQRAERAAASHAGVPDGDEHRLRDIGRVARGAGRGGLEQRRRATEGQAAGGDAGRQDGRRVAERPGHQRRCAEQGDARAHRPVEPAIDECAGQPDAGQRGQRTAASARAPVARPAKGRLGFAEQGLRIASLPEFAARDGVAAGWLQVVLPAVTERHLTTFRIFWPSGRQASPKVRALVDFLVKQMAGASD